MDSQGNQANNFNNHFAAISGDGRFVAFLSLASNLVPGDTNGTFDVFVHDRQTSTTTRVSVDSQGNQASGTGNPAISADGRFVAFGSDASNLVVGDTNGTTDIFVHDRQTGTTTRVSVDSQGNQANGASIFAPAISADGGFVVFHSSASNLVAGDTNGTGDVFVHDRQTGTTTRVSVDSQGSEGNGDSRTVSISADGRFVAFHSNASNLVAGDTNNTTDVFVHDRGSLAADGDGVDDPDDLCPDTVIPESVPTVRLGTNRWALTDDPLPSGDIVFDTKKPKGKGPNRSYTTTDTGGCSCEQIIEQQGLGNGHTKFGCSISAMDDWVALVNPSKRGAGADATEVAEVPTEYELEAAYPNPFNPQTTIRFALPESAQVTLVVYDVLGRQVRVLVDGVREAGTHEVVFEASDLPSGTYLYRLETPQGSFVQMMQLVK